MDTSANQPVCSQCGAKLASDSDSPLCPKCVAVNQIDSDLLPPTILGGEGYGSDSPNPRLGRVGSKHAGAPPPEELAGIIPGYEITEFLGRGGMGTVYKGIQTSLERDVAIKFLPADLGADPEFEARFRREAKSMARLNHPNIVQIFDYGQTAGHQHYFVMEFVDGTDLSKLVRSGQLDAEGALNAVSQICSALQYAHELGFVHRDIKPANIFINQNGILKVGDFGLAKLVDGHSGQAPISDDFGLTMSGAIVGTPHYAAPEQLDGHSHVDQRADLYSLGVMFYEMLTREIPRGAARPPSRKIAALDVRIDGVVFKAMEPDPDERYQTAVEIRSDIDFIRTTPAQSAEIPPAPVDKTGALHQDESHTLDVAPFRPNNPTNHDLDAGYDSVESVLDPTHSLNSTMMILGVIAILTIGGLAIFIANQKTGDTISTETTITNSETHNNYFTQLIAFGITTAKDLENIIEFHPYGSGFVGISKEGLSWNQASELAQRTGADILSVEDGKNGSKPELLAWLSTSYASHVSSSLWVRERGEARLLNGSKVLIASELNSPRRAIFQWGAPKPNTDSVPDQPPVPEIPPSTPTASEAPPAINTEPTSPPPPKTSTAISPPTLAAPDSAPFKWINTEGKTIQAKFVRLSGESVVILMDGKSFTIPFTKLSPDSVEQAKKLGSVNR